MHKDFFFSIFCLINNLCLFYVARDRVSNQSSRIKGGMERWKGKKERNEKNKDLIDYNKSSPLQYSIINIKLCTK